MDAKTGDAPLVESIITDIFLQHYNPTFVIIDNIYVIGEVITAEEYIDISPDSAR